MDDSLNVSGNGQAVNSEEAEEAEEVPSHHQSAEIQEDLQQLRDQGVVKTRRALRHVRFDVSQCDSNSRFSAQPATRKEKKQICIFYHAALCAHKNLYPFNPITSLISKIALKIRIFLFKCSLLKKAPATRQAVVTSMLEYMKHIRRMDDFFIQAFKSLVGKDYVAKALQAMDQRTQGGGGG